MAISGTNVYTAADFSGLLVFPLQCEAVSAAVLEIPGAESRLFGAYPNPFNPQTTLAFELSQQDVVKLRVFGLSGRLVRRLLDGENVSEGQNEIVWNGRDDTGRQVASGAYFYRLEARNFSETKRMVLIK